MSGYSSTDQCPIKGPNQGAPSGESQSSMSLFCPPTRKSTERTCNRRHSPIPTLNDDILLNIFYLYRIVIEGNASPSMTFTKWKCDCERWWYKLAQVSQRWRRLIHSSPSWLDLCLLCTYGVPVADMLAHSPPLPLTIFYSEYNREMTAKDEEGALLALSHHDRLRRIDLWMPAQKLGKLITAMDGLFPILDFLFIFGDLKETMILPQTFQAPNLRQIHLQRVALPIRSPLLTSTAGLVTLRLIDIPRSAYFPPNYILARLSLMPQLEKLVVSFHSPIPNRDVVNTPIVAHVTLPNLRYFEFKGVSAYLEGLLAWISAPVLSTLRVHFFNQLTFTVPHLLEFMQTSVNLISNVVRLAFNRNSVRLSTQSLDQNGQERFLWLVIMCRHLDWQVASAAQILGTISPVLSVVKDLKLDHWEHNLSSEWHNEVDRAQWRELLRPFSNVNTLHVKEELAVELSRSLCSEDGEMPLELLPNLLELKCRGTGSGDAFSDAFTPFVNERQAAGHPVRVVLK
jgi:hypothetical protein